MRSVIGEVEVAEYMYPKLMVDNGGSVYLMLSKGQGFVIGYKYHKEISFLENYENNFGPLEDFHGTITLSNS